MPNNSMRLLTCALLVQASLQGSNSSTRLQGRNSSTSGAGANTTHADAPVVTPEATLPAGPSQPRDAQLLDHERAPSARQPAPTDVKPNPPLQRLDDAHFGSRPNFVVLLLDDSGFNDLGVACEKFGASRTHSRRAHQLSSIVSARATQVRRRVDARRRRA
jgi:hypothetical protein